MEELQMKEIKKFNRLLCAMFLILIVVYLSHAQIGVANEVTSHSLVETELLTLTYEVVQEADQLSWQVHYEKRTDTPTKLQLMLTDQRLRNVQSKEMEEMKAAIQPVVWIEKEWLSQSEGNLQFKTTLTETDLELVVELSEKQEDSDDVEKSITLSPVIKGPHQLVANVATSSTEISSEPEEAKEEVEANEIENPKEKVESGVKEVTRDEEEETAEEAIPSFRSAYAFRSAPADLERFDLKMYKDLFEYFDESSSPKEEKGIYPKHNTNKYLKDNQIKINEKKTIKNFEYGIQTIDTIKTNNILNGPLDFYKGYHNYSYNDSYDTSNVLTKKTVKPNPNDETKFDIELDVIGGATETPKQIDVVFVLDKSSSMNFYQGNEKRWSILQKSMNTFLNGLLNQGDIQIGIVSFGSERENQGVNGFDRTVFADVATFKNQKAYTKEVNDVLNHSIYKSEPKSNSGTPTFMGIDAGVDLLTNQQLGARNGAEKHLIVLTDGVATYAPLIGNYRFDKLSTSRKNQESVNRYFTKSTSSYTYSTYNKDQYLAIGNGTENIDNKNQSLTNTIENLTTTYANPALPKNTKKYSIGFSLDSSNIEANILLQNISGNRNVYYADSRLDINRVLEQIKRNILEKTTNFELGSVIDPMSDFVEFVPESINKYALVLDEYNSGEKNISIVESDFEKNNLSYMNDAQITYLNNEKTISISDLNLGAYINKAYKERHGIRLTYQVQLKEEYFDGNYYPTNGPTFAQAFNYSKPLGFAVPSVRVRPEKGSLSVKKDWHDQENVWQKRQDIIIQLQRREKGSNGKWEDVPNQHVSLSKDKAETEFKHEFKEVLFRSGNKQYEYRVEERVNDKNTGVAGYEKPKYSHEAIDQTKSNETMTVINELKYLPLELKKVGHDGETPLADVGFTLYEEGSHESIGKEVTSDSKGKINFGSLPIGRYVLKETTPLIGYQAMEDIHFEIVQDETSRELSFKGLPENSILVNRLKDFQLQIEKKDQYGRPVPNVTFQLKGKDYDKKQAADESSGKGNTFTFKGLKPGEYTLEEVEVNSHYVLLEKPIKIVISDIGEVTIDDELLQNVLTKEGNIIHLEVTNTAKGILPATGGTGYQTFKKVGTVLLVTGMIVMGYYLWRNRQEVA